MYIEPIACPRCGARGFPGEKGFRYSAQSAIDDAMVTCDCGHNVHLAGQALCDQLIRSTNIFLRLRAASNASEYGNIKVKRGSTAGVVFHEPFDMIGSVFLTPDGDQYVKEYYVDHRGMVVMAASPADRPTKRRVISISWMVYGIRNAPAMDAWRELFFRAIVQAKQGLYRQALLDYATAFEAFLGQFLGERLRLRYDDAAADYLLHHSWQIETRLKHLLQLAIGHRLTECPEVYSSWLEDVKSKRDKLIHGERLDVTLLDAEKAHCACYQAIRWIQDTRHEDCGQS